MFVLLEMIIRHHSTWDSEHANHPEQAQGPIGSSSSKGGTDGNSSRSARCGGSSSSSGGGEVGSSSGGNINGSGGSGSGSCGGGSSGRSVWGKANVGAGGGSSSSDSGGGGSGGGAGGGSGSNGGGNSSSGGGDSGGGSGGDGPGSSGSGGGGSSDSSGGGKGGGGSGRSSSGSGGRGGCSDGGGGGGGGGSSSSGGGDSGCVGGGGGRGRGRVGSSCCISGSGGSGGGGGGGDGGGNYEGSNGVGDCGKGRSSSGGGEGSRNPISSSSCHSAICDNSSRDSTIQLNASRRGSNSRSLVLTEEPTGSLLAPLYLLVLLTHPSRCSPAAHASSMAAAMPLLGALVSSVKAVRVSGVLFLGSAARVEPFYLMLLLSKHAFQLLDGKLTILQGGACQQQHTSAQQEESGATVEERHQHGQTQQQQRVSCQQEVTWEICRDFLWIGLQLFARATTAVHSFAVMGGTISLECIRNPQLAEALVAAAPPTVKNVLQQMLQQARGAAEGGAGLPQEEAASTAAAGGGATGAGLRAAAAGAGERAGGQALTVAAAEAGGTTAGRGDGAGGRAQGEAVLEPLAAMTAALAGGALAPAPEASVAPEDATASAAGRVEASAASQLYSGLQALCTKGGLAALIMAVGASCIATKPEFMLQSESLFLRQHADFWQQVLADTEEGKDPPGTLLGGLFQTAASFEKVFKQVPDQLLLTGNAASDELLVQMRRAVPSLQLPLDSINAHEPTQGPYFAVLAARYIYSINLLMNNIVEVYHQAAPISFCCGNYNCWVMQGSTEVGLVMGGAGGGGGRGGYCAVCKRVCYCSETCQREGWEEHKKVCSRYQEEKVAVGGQEGNISSIPSNSG